MSRSAPMGGPAHRPPDGPAAPPARRRGPRRRRPLLPAERRASRLVGLLGTPDLADDEALWLRALRAASTRPACGRRSAAPSSTPTGRVLRVVDPLRRWRAARRRRRAGGRRVPRRGPRGRGAGRPPGAGRVIRALAIDGGGVRGIIPATVLAALEELSGAARPRALRRRGGDVDRRDPGPRAHPPRPRARPRAARPLPRARPVDLPARVEPGTARDPAPLEAELRGAARRRRRCRPRWSRWWR